MTVDAPTLMLTVDETAKELRVSRSYAKKLIAAGTVPSVSIGRSRRVRSADLAAYVAGLPAAEPSSA